MVTETASDPEATEPETIIERVGVESLLDAMDDEMIDTHTTRTTRRRYRSDE